MAAVICRVVAFPGSAKTEYLSSPPDQPESWTDKADQAFVFPSHGFADRIAEVLRETLKRKTNPNGQRRYFFIHARTVESNEIHRFTPPRMPAAHRVDRRRRREAELRAQDLAELEQQEAYG